MQGQNKVILKPKQEQYAMTNNKPNFNVKPIEQHIKQGVKPNPDDVVKAAREAEEAKLLNASSKEAVSDEAVDVKEAEVKEEAASDESGSKDSVKKTRKRLTRTEWVAILEKKEREGLTAAEVAEQHNVTEGNVYQWASKLKAEAEAEIKKAEAAKLSPSSIVDDALKLMAGITKELDTFDSKVAEAKAMVDNAAKERKVIEDSKNKYITIVELLGSEEDKAKLKEVEAELQTKGK